MDTDSLVLADLRQPLEEALVAYEQQAAGLIQFGDFPDLYLTPGKPNTARTIIPVIHSGAKVADLYAILFQPGDGTGDSKTFGTGRLWVPPALRYCPKGDKVTPRAKTGVVCEGFFPLFSLSPRGEPVMYAASLEELTVDNPADPNEIVPAWTLGQSSEDFRAAVYSGKALSPQASYTCGTRDGKRFGDPHSIVHCDLGRGKLLQLAGFLTITDEHSPILRLADSWTLPPGYD